MSTTREDAETTLLQLMKRSKALGEPPYDMDNLVNNAKRDDYSTDIILFALWSLVEQGKIVIQDDLRIRLVDSEKS